MARILVIEDNPQNLKLTTIILKSAGHGVTGAMNATEAERSLATEVPDLIVMDVALPGKDGYTLTRELRQRPATARLPILALSAFAMPGDAEKALRAGCTDYLTKPVRRAPLLERIDHLLGTNRTVSPDPSGPAPANIASTRPGASTIVSPSGVSEATTAPVAPAPPVDPPPEGSAASAGDRR
ncbi:MAG TPA: response regulator [Thermoplasmata archaeon]|nr:response regulator [Thermoplasmata archaeon]